ncbi:MAG: hypothetical protein CUN55_02625 [Phototrophicales bacterium]|nr:MAG: hypothetical protein CUN55_02625 [Phototrophicales bacterium]
MVDIVQQWQELIDATEALNIDDDPLVIELPDPNDLRMALIAMVLYSSRIQAQALGWGIALDYDEKHLFIKKIRVPN